MTFTGQIKSPPRSTTFGAVLVIGLIILFGLFQTRPFPEAVQTWLPCAILLLLPLSIASRSLYAVHLNLLIAFYYLFYRFPYIHYYPFSHLTLLLLYFYTVLLIPPLRGSIGWAHLGKFDKTTWALVLITIFIPIIALMAWVHFLSPNLSRYGDMVPNMPIGLIILYTVTNAAFNAALEEITWRGVILEALDSAVGPGAWAIIIQAISFAAAHYRNGFPNGMIGSAMVVVFGLMLGMIRRQSKGIVAGWLAHTAVDATIFCLVLHFIRQSA